jgi:hypothetical protein
MHPSWIKLKNSVLSAFKLGGGDFDAGQRTFKMLKSAGLEDIKIRAAVLALQDNHPYKRLPVQFAISLRKRIIENDLLTDIELDKSIQDVEAIAADPDTIVISFIVTQVWGRKP